MSLEDTTIRVPDSDSDTGLPRSPALTVLFHPDVRRVGEVSRLARRAELSRATPEFTRPGGRSSRPLLDQGLSRRSIVLESGPGGPFRIAPAAGGSSARVQGEKLAAAMEFTRDALDDGVVIELGNRVVLLWHLVGPAREQRTGDLGLVGHSDGIAELRADLLRVADLSHSVLVTGESGSGKELVAQAIHRASERRDGPCICVNMATIPPSTAASQLFGHVKGAFTGAGNAHTGFFARSDRGTLFLDEVGDTPADVQVMLLRAIETGEIEPLGAESPQAVDVRFIAATDADLAREVDEGNFRGPLFHRLSSVVLIVPPLRARRDDIGRLFFHFLRVELEAIDELERLEPPSAVEATWIPASLLAELARFHWPGNVRQLRNVARQLTVANRGASRFRVPPALSRLLQTVPLPGTSASVESGRASREPSHRASPVAEHDLSDGTENTSERKAGRSRARTDPATISEEQLIAALRTCGWQPSRTAAHLGISRTLLYKLMNKSTRIRKARDLTRDEIQACFDEHLGDLDAMSGDLEVSKRGLQLRMAELAIG